MKAKMMLSWVLLIVSSALYASSDFPSREDININDELCDPARRHYFIRLIAKRIKIENKYKSS